MKIYKYDLRAYPHEYQLPKGAQFLCVQTQRNQPEMWFLVNPDEPKKEGRKFVAVATGKTFESTNGQYRGTFQLDAGALVFHLFEFIE